MAGVRGGCAWQVCVVGVRGGCAWRVGVAGWGESSSYSLQEAHASLVARKKRGTPLQRGIRFKRIGMMVPHGRPLAARVLKVSNVPLVTDYADLKALIERYGACDGLVIPSDGGGKLASHILAVGADGPRQHHTPRCAG